MGDGDDDGGDDGDDDGDDDGRHAVIDEAVRAMAEREAAWDPLRERRVLARVEAELDRRGARRRVGRWVPAAMVAVAAILVAVLAWPRGEVASGQAILGGLASAVEPLPAVEVGSLPAIPAMPAGAIALGDGSIATLHDGARIELRVQTPDETRIAQSLGRVHYEVRPGLPRTFVVEADDVRVIVVGTAFWVTHDPDAVRVTVEHGRVRVQRDGDDAAVIAELGAGDELRVGTAPEVTPAVRPARPIAKLRTKPVAEGPSVDELLAQADDARAHSDLAAAAAALRQVVEQHRDDPRAYGSAFQLGKIERSRGRHAAAARAFTGAAERSPAGALTEDARAEAAISWFDGGLYTEAREAGEDYLSRHPEGAHVARVQRMLQRLP